MDSDDLHLYLVSHFDFPGRERYYNQAHRTQWPALWETIRQGTAVTDDALSGCVMDIRKALGDDSRQQRFLKTVSKAGYRFVGPVEAVLPQSALGVVETEITTFKVEEINPPSVSEESLRQADMTRSINSKSGFGGHCLETCILTLNKDNA